MNMQKCKRGHFYDGDLDASCPYCREEAEKGGNAMDVIEKIDPTRPVDDTYPAKPITGGRDITIPPDPGFDGGGTVHINDRGGSPGVDIYDEQTIPVNPHDLEAGFNPVVGWLVCIDGPDRGNDYPIHSNVNYIGRGENMDICIRGDLKVSREKAAMIAFDDEENSFFFGPSDGRNIVRSNGKIVMAPVGLSAYDVLTVGSTQLLFIPLCGDRFTWKDGPAKADTEN